jgi:hypothetical protein
MLLTGDARKVIGRGGQAVFTFCAYHAFTKALVRSMETSSVSYGIFKTITLSDVSLSGLFILCRDFASNARLREKLAILWIITSASFILIFPTLASAMTGYSANSKAFIQSEGQLIPFSAFRLIRYVIHDGSRVGLYDPYFVNVNLNITEGNPLL